MQQEALAEGGGTGWAGTLSSSWDRNNSKEQKQLSLLKLTLSIKAQKVHKSQIYLKEFHQVPMVFLPDQERINNSQNTSNPQAHLSPLVTSPSSSKKITLLALFLLRVQGSSELH